MKSFLRLFNVRSRFVPKFGSIAATLNANLWKFEPTVFGKLNTTEQEAFSVLK